MKAPGAVRDSSTVIILSRVKPAEPGPRGWPSPPLVSERVGGGVQGPSGGAKSSQENFKVLMMKRSAKSKFMPNAYVFPGGVLEPSDGKWPAALIPSSSRMSIRSTQHRMESAARTMETSREPGDSLARRIGALREVFEETGLALVRNGVDLDCDLLDVPEMDQMRDRVYRDPASFMSLFRGRTERPALDCLAPWSQWTTPRTSSTGRRFDTTFFLAPLKPSLRLPRPSIDSQGEASEMQWIRPSEALRAHQLGSLWLAPPTVVTLQELESFCEVDDIIAFASKRAVRDYIPKSVVVDDHPEMVVFPGDRLYHPCEASTEGSLQFLRIGRGSEPKDDGLCCKCGYDPKETDGVSDELFRMQKDADSGAWRLVRSTGQPERSIQYLLSLL